MLLKRLQTFIPRGEFTRNVITLAGSTVISQALSVAASPILTRLYTPEDFGVLAAFVSLFSVLLAVNSLRYELAIPIPEDDRTAIYLVVIVFILVVVTSAAFLAIFLLFSNQITALLKVPRLAPFYWVLVACLMSGGFYQALNYWAIRKRRFHVIARTKLAQIISALSIQLLAGLASIGAGGLVAGTTLGQIVANVSLVRMIAHDDRSSFRGIQLSELWETAKRYRRFPLFASWSSLLNVGSLQLPALLLTIIYGPSVAGWFALSQRIISIPMTIVGSAIAQVYFASASQLAREDTAALERFFNKTARRLFFVGVLPITVIGFAGPWLFEQVLGSNWRTSGEFVQIMTPMFLAQFVVSTLAQTIIVLERQDIQSLWDLTRFLLVVGVFVLASALNIDAYLAIGLYSGCMLLTYILLFILNIRTLKRHKEVTANA